MTNKRVKSGLLVFSVFTFGPLDYLNMSSMRRAKKKKAGADMSQENSANF